MESLQLDFKVSDIFTNKLMQTLSRIVKPMQTWLQFLSYFKLLLCRNYCPLQRNCSHNDYVTFTLLLLLSLKGLANLIWLFLTRRLKHNGEGASCFVMQIAQPWLQPLQCGCVQIRQAHLDAAMFHCPFNAIN